jgi:uncharacterized membrane protein (DUF485 family)
MKPEPHQPQHAPSASPVDIHSEAFLQSLMRGQRRLSAACAAAFMLVLLGLPLLNYVWPEILGRRVFGFTWTWLILGVLFFPFVWLIAFVFIRRSIQLEQREVAQVRPTAEAEPPAAP